MYPYDYNDIRRLLEKNYNISMNDFRNIVKLFAEISDNLAKKTDTPENVEDVNTKKQVLLQEDMNFADDISKKKSECADIEHKICDLTQRLETLRGEISVLESKHTEIHKKWIAEYPAPKAYTTKVPESCWTIRDVFKSLFNIEYHRNLTDNEVREFKKFDNLVNNRCRTSVIFGKHTTRNDIFSKLTSEQFDCIQRQIQQRKSK